MDHVIVTVSSYSSVEAVRGLQLGDLDAVYRRFTSAREEVLKEASPSAAKDAYNRLLPHPSRYIFCSYYYT